jgi:hypothetical protein
MAIDINPAHKGKFTRRGISVGEGLKSGDKTVREEANFARMAKRHFKPLGAKKRTSSDRAHKLYGGK